MIEGTYWLMLLAATWVSFVYFRDLGDVSQAVLSVERKNMIFAIRHENLLVGSALTLLTGAGLLHAFRGIGPEASMILIGLDAFFLVFPWLWVHIGLRHQQKTARFYSCSDAARWIRPEESVLVIENNGVARAHADNQIKRPHLTGTESGLDGENVIMTYCAMSHLGIAVKPELDNQRLDLEVVAQHGNNLLMRDKATGEPIQQMYRKRECGGRALPMWPTWRMPYRAFRKAYPQGEVFVNPVIPFGKNPLLFLFDHLVEIVFLWALIPHHHSEELLFETMDVEDTRLARKALVWGVTLNGESVAITEDYLHDEGDLVEAVVGGRKVVFAWNSEYESLGAFFNDSDQQITQIDFSGISNIGQLTRVDTLYPGLYWFVWVNFFSDTRLNAELERSFYTRLAASA